MRALEALFLVLVLVALGWPRSPGQAKAVASPDAGVALPEWDGHCYGRPGDDGMRVVWRRTVYLCRDNGPPNHWWFVQDPEYSGNRVIP